MSKLSAPQRLNAILALLEKAYGRREPYKSHPPIEQVLVTLLLTDGKESSALRTIKRLEREFVDWNELRVCEPPVIDQVLGKNFPPGVGQHVRDALTAIFNNSQAMNLDEIMGLAPEHAEVKLKRLSPMPSRVAGELLLAGLKYDRLPEGAGLLRVARRIRLAPQGPPEAQIKSMRRLISGSLIPRAFHALEMHAERVCTPEGYGCPACPVNAHCPTGEERIKRQRIQVEKAAELLAAAEAAALKEKEAAAKSAPRKRVAAEKLKQALHLRSEQLKISVRTQKRRAKPVPPPPARMVQASSADVKPRRTKKKRRSSRAKSRTHAALPRS